MIKIAVIVLIGLAFILDAILRYTSLGMDYVISSIFMGYGLDSFSYLNVKDLLLFLGSGLVGILLIFLAYKTYRKATMEEEEPSKDYVLSCKDCKQCYPQCPLNLYQDEIPKHVYKEAFYNFKEYRKDSSNKAYDEYLSNEFECNFEEEEYDEDFRGKTKINFVKDEEW